MGEPQTMYGWFGASVAAHGDAVALEVNSHRLSYTELAGLADHVADALIRFNRGRVPGRVGVLAARSLLAYAGYLAAQRLGATVVPLNPAFPPARNADITRAAELDAVVTDQDVQPGTEPSTPVLRLGDEALSALIGRVPRGLPESRAASDGTAYILFTSGSTGAPKGVPITHGNVSAFLAEVIARVGAGPGDRWSQTFDPTFDPSVFDMFAAWGSGATLVVPARNHLLSPVRFVNRHGITHWSSVPSVVSLAQRLRALRPGSMPTLRWSNFCGEPLTVHQAEAWQQAAQNSVLENSYGPTELTVTCTAYRLPLRREDWPTTANGTVPIGVAHHGLETLILGDDGLPGPDGELCVRGAQRFPGYADPANDVGRFLSFEGGRASGYDGSVPLTGRHWYRTGDRVAVLGDGLVHLGRLDHQVKVNGYRIETGEIEAALRTCHGVSEAVVFARETARGETELVAACTGSPGSEAELRNTLGLRLPAYMLPRRFLTLAELPVNQNGKTDRAALAAMLEE